METPRKVNKGEKRGPTLRFKGIVIFGVILLSYLFPAVAKADVVASQLDASVLGSGYFTSGNGTSWTLIPSVATGTVISSLTLNLGDTGPGAQFYVECVTDSGDKQTVLPAFTASTTGILQIALTNCTFDGAGVMYLGVQSPIGGSVTVQVRGASSGGGLGITPYFIAEGGEEATTTRIVDFAPNESQLIPTGDPVVFSLHAYVAPEDIGTFIGVRFTLENIDQNVFLLSSLSPSSFYLLDGFRATTSGHFYYTSEPKYLGDGNYMVAASLERSYLGGWVVNPFSPINDTQTHQFIVGSSTFIGNLQQKAFGDLQTFFASSTATSTDTTARDCNPLAFSTQGCLAYLFIPSGKDLQNTLLGAKDMVLVRVPWGYGTRLMAILNQTATSALPAFNINLHLGAGNETNPATSTLTFDMDDTLSGGGALLSSIRDPNYGKSVRDIFEPLIKLTIALSVIFIIYHDLTGTSHHAPSGSAGENTAMAKQARLTKREYTF